MEQPSKNPDQQIVRLWYEIFFNKNESWHDLIHLNLLEGTLPYMSPCEL